MYLVILKRFLPSGAAAIENHSIKMRASETPGLFMKPRIFPKWLISPKKKTALLNVVFFIIYLFS